MKQHRETTRLKLPATIQLYLILISLVPILCGPFALHALEVRDLLSNHWDMSNGLPSNTIIAVAQTPDGYLWFATGKGLVRFDGLTFTPITIPPADHTTRSVPTGSDDTAAKVSPVLDCPALYTDRNGTLWVGTSAGLAAFDQNKPFYRFYTVADGLSADRIRHISGDMKGNLWISFFSSYVNRFKDGVFTKFNPSHGLTGKKINAIIEDRNGTLLLGSRENGVFRFDGHRFSPFPTGNSQYLITMLEDSRGDLWIGTGNGLLRLRQGKRELFTTMHGLSHNYITALRQDSGGFLWVGTVKGLNRLQLQEDNVLIERLLPEVLVTCLFLDPRHSLWVGTFNSGIRQLREPMFEPFAPLRDQPDIIPTAITQDGDVWVGTFSGELLRCSSDKIREHIKPPGFIGTAVTALCPDGTGGLWVGTNGKGVYLHSADHLLHLDTTKGLADNLVTAIFKDSRGDVWFGTMDGVSRLRNGVLETLIWKRNTSGKGVHNIYQDHHQNILIVADRCITVLKKGEWTENAVSYLLKGTSLASIYLEQTTPDRPEQVLWVAEHGIGLKRLAGKQVVTRSQGSPAKFIYQILEDRRGNFWMMSEEGILRVKKTDLDNFAAPIHFRTFGISDGMPSLEFNNAFSCNSALHREDGQMLFITKKGIIGFYPDQLPVDKTAPLVKIESVLFNESSTAQMRGSGNLTVKFTAPAFIAPERVSFKYRLEGRDPGPGYLPAGQERVVRYQALPPGNYTFRIRAANADGVWADKDATVTFSIKPFVYQTLLFKLLVLLLVVAAATGLGYWLIKKPGRKKGKYKNVALHPDFAAQCINKLNSLMVVDQIYRDDSLSLQTLAEKVGITQHQLSQLLNEKLQRSFPEFINHYRIEEAKQLLAAVGKQPKVIEVAFMVGFNTKAAFYNAFKKITKMTPTQYREQINGSGGTRGTSGNGKG